VNPLKLKYVGLAGGAIAFVSLLLPWWTMAISWTANIFGTQMTQSMELNVYPYKSGLSVGSRVTLPVDINLVSGTVVVLLVVIGGLLGITGSLIKQRSSMIIAVGGMLVLLSAALFIVNMHSELLRSEPLAVEVPRVGLFSTGTFGVAFTRSYSAYLSFGFWLALVGGAITLIASTARAPMTNGKRYCTFCGARLGEDDVFCRKCGKILDRSAMP